MRKKVCVIVLFLTVFLAITFLRYKFINKPEVVVCDATTISLEGKSISFTKLGTSNFTSTGLAFDKNDNAFWIGDYGALKSTDTPAPRVVEMDKDLSNVLNIVDLSSILSSDDNLQGVAWDQTNDSLWLAVGDSCINIKKDGTLLSKFNLGKYKKYKSNGICVDEDSLWVLCYSKYMLHFNKSGQLLNEYSFNLKDQDMLFNNGNELLVTVGADYNGESNYVVSFEKSTGKTSVKYQVVGAYAVEGISIVDNKMYIVNDGLYHDAKIKESYFAIYDLMHPSIPYN